MRRHLTKCPHVRGTFLFFQLLRLLGHSNGRPRTCGGPVQGPGNAESTHAPRPPPNPAVFQFYKNLALQRRQVGTTLVQLLIPAGLVCLIGLVQYLIDTVAANNDPPAPEFFAAFNLSATVPLNGLGVPSVVDMLFALPFFYYSAPSWAAADVGFATYEGVKQGLLGQVAQVYQRDITLPIANQTLINATYWPFFEAQESAEAVNDQLVDVYQRWKVLLKDDGLGPAPEPENNAFVVNQTLSWFANREYDKLLPYGGMASKGGKTPVLNMKEKPCCSTTIAAILPT